jgi:hypothetical protein
MRRSIRRASALSVVVLLGLGACSDDEKSDDTQPAPVDTSVDTSSNDGTETSVEGASTGGITIGDFAFQIPGPVTAGQEFTVTNNDRTAHTFSEVAGAFTLRVDGDSDDTMTIDEAGT